MDQADSKLSNQGILTDWILFAQIINQTLQIPSATVEHFLLLIDCHPALRGLTAIADHLIELLPLVRQFTDDWTLNLHYIPAWLQICQHVVENKQAFAAEFAEIDPPKVKGTRAPFPNQFEQYPLYIALWYPANSWARWLQPNRRQFFHDCNI
jgi:hypothetical protein